MKRGYRFLYLCSCVSVCSCGASPRPVVRVHPIEVQQNISIEDKERQSEALFNEGMKLKEGVYTDCRGAIAKFEASRKAYPESNEARFATCFQMGECHEELGETASAWSDFQCAAAAARSLDGWGVEVIKAETRVKALEPKLCSLKLVVDPEVQVEGLQVSVSGDGWLAAKWNTEQFINPKVHWVKAEAPGCEPWATETYLGGVVKIVNVVVPKLRCGETSVGFWTPWRSIVIGAGIVGTAGIIAGIVFSADAASASQEEERLRAQVSSRNDNDNACLSPITTDIQSKCIRLGNAAAESDRYAWGAMVSALTGFSALVVGGVLLNRGYWDKPVEKMEPRRVEVTGGPPGTRVGLGVMGRF